MSGLCALLSLCSSFVLCVCHGVAVAQVLHRLVLIAALELLQVVKLHALDLLHYHLLSLRVYLAEHFVAFINCAHSQSFRITPIDAAWCSLSMFCNLSSLSSPLSFIESVKIPLTLSQSHSGSDICRTILLFICCPYIFTLSRSFSHWFWSRGSGGTRSARAPIPTARLRCTDSHLERISLFDGDSSLIVCCIVLLLFRSQPKPRYHKSSFHLPSLHSEVWPCYFD